MINGKNKPFVPATALRCGMFGRFIGGSMPSPTTVRRSRCSSAGKRRLLLLLLSIAKLKLISQNNE
jgi:hypothetical protein